MLHTAVINGHRFSKSEKCKFRMVSCARTQTELDFIFTKIFFQLILQRLSMM